MNLDIFDAGARRLHPYEHPPLWASRCPCGKETHSLHSHKAEPAGGPAGRKPHLALQCVASMRDKSALFALLRSESIQYAVGQSLLEMWRSSWLSRSTQKPPGSDAKSEPGGFQKAS